MWLNKAILISLQLVKEQKGRITELARSKHEQIADFKVSAFIYQSIDVDFYIIIYIY